MNNNRWILLCGTLVLLAFRGCIPEEEGGSLLDVYDPRADWGEVAPGDGANAEPIGDQFNAVAGDEAGPAGEEDPPGSVPEPLEEDQPADADEQDDAAEDSDGGSEDGFLIAYFDTDGHAGQGFDGCYAAEGRIGSTAAKKNHTSELRLGEDSGAPTVQSDFDWENGEPHSFHIVWNTATVSFQVDDVVLQTAFACEPINAVNVRSRANKGVIEVSDLAINDRGIPQSVAAASDPGNDLSIMRIEGDFGDTLTLTGTVLLTWDAEHPPKNSQLAFRVTAGQVAGAEPDPPADCNDNGVADDQDILSGAEEDCNGNGIPDSCDLADGASSDVNGNGVPDECEPDCNGNGIPDTVDIADGTSTDCDVDGTPDECQADSDGDGVIDQCEDCPNDPNKTEPGECGCGVPDADSDEDGVLDCDDLCPDTPADAEVDEFGCPLLAAGAGDDVTLDEVSPVVLQGSASGGTPPYSFSWSAEGWCGSTEPTPTVLPAETTIYTLTVTDESSPPQSATDTVTITINPPQDVGYAIVELGSLSSNTSYPTSINDLGQVVGYYHNENELPEKRAFLYSEGALIDLGTLGGNEAHARDINDAGQVVGESRTASGDWHAFLWDSANGMQDLGTLGGASSWGYAINESGQVVGYYALGSVVHAFLYSDGAMHDLGAADYLQSAAFDINDHTQAVGTLVDESGNVSALFYDDGLLIDLGSPLLSGSQTWVINNSGLAAGHSWDGNEYRSYLYADGTVIDLGTLDGFVKTYAFGINDTGQVVGSVTDLSGTLSRACLYTGGQLQHLGDLLSPEHGWEYLVAAYSINGSGQIVGYGLINGEYRAFLMTPGP